VRRSGQTDGGCAGDLDRKVCPRTFQRPRRLGRQMSARLWWIFEVGVGCSVKVKRCRRRVVEKSRYFSAHVISASALTLSFRYGRRQVAVSERHVPDLEKLAEVFGQGSSGCIHAVFQAHIWQWFSRSWRDGQVHRSDNPYLHSHRVSVFDAMKPQHHLPNPSLQA
jgi:hypothetical protein